MTMDHSTTETIPEAEIRSERKIPWIWIIPLVSLAAVIVLIILSHRNQGVPVHIAFQNGHGLKAGDAVKYRGIEIGTIRNVTLSRDLKSIEAVAWLDPSAKATARKGSRFWIVRPRLGIGGAGGLDTVIGPNYVSVLPGNGPFEDHFEGLETPPFMDDLEAGGLEIALRTPVKGELSAGAPVTYRQIAVGTVMTVDLARDAGSVEASIYVLPAYASLICERTKFWKSGGARLNAGLGGFSLRLDSLRSLLEGGVNIAIPPDPGRPVNAGHCFELSETPEPEWLTWKPFLNFRESDRKAIRPRMARARLSWSGLFQHKARDAWVAPVSRGFLGPSNVLGAYADDDSRKLKIWMDDTVMNVSETPKLIGEDLAVIFRSHPFPVWPDSQFRRPSAPENTIISTSGEFIERYVAQNHYTEKDGYWEINDEIQFDSDWNGACVLSDRDSKVIGILIVEDDSARMVPADYPNHTRTF